MPSAPSPQTLSSFAKARMILSAALVKRRVVTDVAPLEQLLSDLGSEPDEWIRVLLSSLPRERIGGGPLELDPSATAAESIKASVDTLRALAEGPPKCLEHSNNWETLCPLSEKYFRRELPEAIRARAPRVQHFKLREAEEEEGRKKAKTS